MMRIAFCLFRYFPYGGLQRDFLKIAAECQKRGNEIHVFTTSWEGDVPTGFAVELIAGSAFSNHGRAVDFSRRVGERLVAGRFDVVVGFNKIAGLDVYFAADPCYAARIAEKGSGLCRFLPRCHTYMQLEKGVFGSGSKTQILCLTEDARDQYRKHYDTPAGRFHLLPPGISRAAVDWNGRTEIRRAVRDELGLGDADFLLLMVGSGFRTKGVDRSIGALALLPEELRRRCRLVIIGQGKAAPLEKLAHRLEVADRVRFLGPRNDVPRFLLGADLLLHPSVTEAAGMVLLESLLAGLPVLASAVCGYAFHIERAGAGMLIPEPFSTSDFATRLEGMLTSSELSAWSRNGRRYAETVDLYSLAEQAADVIEGVARAS